MAYSSITKPADYFNTVLYTGNGSTNNITVGFQPDFVWIKNRDVGTANHCLMDVIRGFGTGSNDTPLVNSNTTDAEFDRDVFSSTGITSTGYELDTYVDTNANTQDFVSWNWLAGGTASSNTDGSITSQVSANTTSGFSIVSYSGNSTGGATVGHSLGATPSLIIVKDRTTSSYHWQVYHKSLGATKYIQLSLSDAEVTGINRWNNTEPTSSVFTLGSSLNVNGTGQDYIAYCFAEKKGFSKFGSYTGNGSADGTFVYTGFKPAFTIIKNASASYDWLAQDSTRQADANFDGNPVNILNQVNASNAESNASTRSVDYLSNGFKIRQNTAAWNTSGNTFIYMAFAENPLVANTGGGIPATAR